MHFVMINNQSLGGTTYAGKSAPRSRSRFPSKLRQILDDAEVEGNQHIVGWLPDGNAFQVFKPKVFASNIVGRYFNHGNYRSFTRQLYHYGFEKVSSGVNTGAFYHRYFQRDNPSLADLMIGQDKKAANKKKISVEQDEKSDAQSFSALSKGNSPIQDFALSSASDQFDNPFQDLDSVRKKTQLLEGSDQSSLHAPRGLGALLDQIANEDDVTTMKHFMGDVREKFSMIPGSSADSRRNRVFASAQERAFASVQESGFDSLFGGTNVAVVEEASAATQTIAHSGQGGHLSRRSNDWLSIINQHLPEDEDLSADLEPRPIEEMVLASKKLSRKSGG